MDCRMCFRNLKVISLPNMADNAPSDPGTHIAGIKGGNIPRPDDGAWPTESVIKGYSRSGSCCVRTTLRANGPKLDGDIKDEEIVMANERVPQREAMRAIPVSVTPLQIKTLADLCVIYGKTRDTIKKWYQEGAPINFDGANYSADYHLLEAWRLRKFSKFKDF